MHLNSLSAISPIDGRYRSKTEKLAPYFSEWALIKYRVHVEVEYFIALCELPLPQLASFDKSSFPELRKIVSDFSEKDAQAIKEIEKTTNHDVKAVENQNNLEEALLNEDEIFNLNQHLIEPVNQQVDSNYWCYFWYWKSFC